MIIFYTDGACSGNPGPGGWGVYAIIGDQTVTYSGSLPDTTNNIMEMQAVIEALKPLPDGQDVTIRTDSQYVVDGITKWIHGWLKRDWKNAQGKPVKNKEQWLEILAQNKRHNVTWEWVRGHAGDEGNEIADKLATGAINGR